MGIVYRCCAVEKCNLHLLILLSLYPNTCLQTLMGGKVFEFFFSSVEYCWKAMERYIVFICSHKKCGPFKVNFSLTCLMKLTKPRMWQLDTWKSVGFLFLSKVICQCTALQWQALFARRKISIWPIVQPSIDLVLPGGAPVHRGHGVVAQGRHFALHALHLRLWGGALLLPTQVCTVV